MSYLPAQRPSPSAARVRSRSCSARFFARGAHLRGERGDLPAERPLELVGLGGGQPPGLRPLGGPWGWDVLVMA